MASNITIHLLIIDENIDFAGAKIAAFYDLDNTQK